MSTAKVIPTWGGFVFTGVTKELRNMKICYMISREYR